jgi:outer membrane lipoprotein LolB
MEVAKSYHFGHILCLNWIEKQRILPMRNLIWIVLLGMALSGCAVTPPVETPSSTPPAAPKATWSDRQTALGRIQSWWASGKIAVQTARDSGSATVTWAQRGGSYNIAMQGPLGSHSMQLTGRPGQVRLQTADGKTYNARSPEQLLATQWGFKLPIANMNYWIRGLPVPSVPANTQFDRYGRLTSLNQAGFRVLYLRYTNVGGVDLPQQMSIASSSLNVKIMIYQWKV